MSNKKNVQKLFVHAAKNSRKRELDKESKKDEIQSNLLKQLKELTGKDYKISGVRKQNSKVAFAQIIQHNVQMLVEHGYLTNAEKTFLFDISGYIEFKSNVIVEKPSKNKKGHEKSSKAATVSYISFLLNKDRSTVSKLLKQMRRKGLVATTETGITTETGRTCTSRTWFVNPNLICCGDKADIDQATQKIFRDTLKNVRDKNGEKIKLPVHLFI